MTVERIVPDGQISVQWSTFGGSPNWDNVNEDIDSPDTGNRNFAFPGDGFKDRFTLTAPVGVETAVRIRVGAHGLRVNSSGLGVITRIFYSGGQIGGDKTLPVFPVLSWGTVWTGWWGGLNLTPAEIGTLEVEYEKDGSVNTAIATLSVEVDFVDPACTTTTTAAPTTTTPAPTTTTSTTAPPTTTTTTTTEPPTTTTTSITHFTTTTSTVPPEIVKPVSDFACLGWSQQPGSFLCSGAMWGAIDEGFSPPNDTDYIDATASVIPFPIRFNMTDPTFSPQRVTAIQVRVRADVNFGTGNLTVRLFRDGLQIGSDKTVGLTTTKQNLWTSLWTGLNLREYQLEDFRVELEAPADSTTYRVYTMEAQLFIEPAGTPDLFIVPDGDVGSSIATFGSGSAKWDRLDNGIIEGTPDDTNGIWGLDGDWWRGSFENPDFLGTTTAIKVRVRAKSDSGSGDFDLILYSDGSGSDGSRNINPTGTFQIHEEVFTIAKTAAELTNLEVRINMLAPSIEDRVSEVEVELVVPGATPTTTSTTSTTVPPVPVQEDEFDDASIADFWTQQKGLEGGATFTEAAGKMSFDSGPGIVPTPDALWHPAQAGDEADVTWLHQQPVDALSPDQIDVKVPFADRPAGFSNEGDTVGIIVWESNTRYAVICKTIRGGREVIQATHMRDTLVRHRRVLHSGWPFYLRVRTIRSQVGVLGPWNLQTFYGEKPQKWIELLPDFAEFDTTKYRAEIGPGSLPKATFKVGVFAHHGRSFPETTTTVTDPPPPGGWVDFTRDRFNPIGPGTKFEWNEDHQAWILDSPSDSLREFFTTSGVYNNWFVGFRASHVRITWDADEQELDDFIKITSWPSTLDLAAAAVPTKSPLVLPMDFSSGEDIDRIKIQHSAIPRQQFIAIKKIEFWKTPTTTTTSTVVTTTTSGPFDGGALCRNKWNPADAHFNMTVENNDYRARHAFADSQAGVRGFGKSTGKLYFEIKATNLGTQTFRGGVATSVWSLSTRLGSDVESWGLGMVEGRSYHNDVQSTTQILPNMLDNDILNVAVDLDAGKIWFGVNNNYALLGKPHLGVNPTFEDSDLSTNTIYPAINIFNQGEHAELFSQEGLTYQPPGGFEPWCSSEACTTTSTAPPTTTSITHFTTTSTTAAPTTTTPAPTTTTSTVGPLACRNQFDPTDVSGEGTLFNNNYGFRNDQIAGGNEWEGARGFPEDGSGKWYFEIKVVKASLTIIVGIAEAAVSLTAALGTDDRGWGWYFTHALKRHNNTNEAWGTAASLGDVVGIAVDLDNGKIWVAVNNVWQEGGDPAAGTGEMYSDADITLNPMYPCVTIFRDQDEVEMWSQESLHYSPPSGFSAWCSAFAGTTTTTTTTTSSTTTTTLPPTTTTSITHFTTTTTTTVDGVWLDKTDNNFWSGSDLGWGAGTWSQTGPGPYELNAIGSWPTDFRPTAIRITAGSIDSTQLRDSSNNDILNPPSGANLISGQVHWLDWVTESPGDIDLLDFNFDGGEISKIEFFLPDSQTTTTTV